MDFRHKILDGDLEGLGLLFERFDDACMAKPYGYSLACISVMEDKIDILKFLISKGCDVRIGDNEHGLTPIHFAAQKNNIGAIEMLLVEGVEVDIEDKYGNTPLMEAVYAHGDHMSSIKLLLEAGANPDINNKFGISPYSLAADSGRVDVVEFFNLYKSVAH